MSQTVELVYDRRLYDPQAIQKAAYIGLPAFTLELQIEGEQLRCTLLSNLTTSAEAFEKAVEEFRKDVLDHQLRLKLKAETEPVRNLILGIAFSNTGLG